jgi:hypothetical protein
MDKLTKEDWTEIYYAIETKLTKVEQGEYGFCKAETNKWKRHLGEIMNKIGLDGCNMYE